LHCLLFIFEHEILHTSGVPLNIARLGDKPAVALVNGRITFVYNLTFLRILWNAVMSIELCIEGCSVIRDSLNTPVSVSSLKQVLLIIKLLC